MVVRRAICGGRRRRWEETRLSARLVGGLVHFGFHLGGLADRVGQLDDQIIIKVVLVGRLGLLCDAGANYLTLDALTPSCCCRSWHRWRGSIRQATLVSVLNGLSIAAVLRDLRASVTFV